MRWDVVLTASSRLPDMPLAIVVDVLRASTSLVAMVANGAERVVIAGSPASALRIGAARGWPVAGEQGGLPPEGFTFGNSPGEFGPGRVAERTFVFSSTNGASAIRAATHGRRVVIGALANLTSVAALALESGTDVVVVCAGFEGGTRPGLDDLYVAGRIVQIAEVSGAQLLDGARIAAACAGAYPKPIDALVASEHGRRLMTLGLSGDLDLCAGLDWTTVVPQVRPGSRPPALEAAPPP
ncbi:MAG: 2-phosphosulfolactate phosphatase [Dehalococcoidia bacterium]